MIDQKDLIVKIVRENFDDNYKKYIRHCKKSGHINGFFSVVSVFLASFVLTSALFSAMLFIWSGITMIRCYSNFKMIPKIEEVYED